MTTIDSFTQNIILLVVTAILTGLLVPFINARIAEQRVRREQAESARLSRQDSILKSQEEFLLHLEKTLFDFHVCAAAVPWYRSMQIDDSRFAAARHAYDDASWKFMAEMHAALSKARRLSSSAALQELERHQSGWYSIDGEIAKLANGERVPPEEWSQLLNAVNNQAADAGRVINILAADYGLVPRRFGG